MFQNGLYSFGFKVKTELEAALYSVCLACDCINQLDCLKIPRWQQPNYNQSTQTGITGINSTTFFKCIMSHVLISRRDDKGNSVALRWGVRTLDT